MAEQNPVEQKKCGDFKTFHVKTRKDGEEEITFRQKNHSEIADLLAEELQGRLAYDHQREEWATFDGCAWLPSKPGTHSEAISAIFRRESWPGGYSDGCYRGSVNVLTYSNCLKMPESRQGIIPFRNGILEIVSGKLLPLTAETAQRWCLPYEYSETSGCPHFKKWLSGLFVNNKDADDIVHVIRCFINACITGKSHLQIFLHLKGVAGSGKSTLARILQKLFAREAVVSSSLQALAEQRFEKARLEGENVRLLLLSELKRYNKDTYYQILKTITGRDAQAAEEKNEKARRSIDFVFAGQVVITSNPDFSIPSDDAAAIGRRARIVEFRRALTSEQQASFLASGGEEALYAEAPGIVNWALELSDEVVNNTLINPPQVIAQAVKRAEFAGSPLSAYIRDRIVLAPGVKTLLGGAETRMEHGKIQFETVEDEETKLLPSYLRYCAVIRQDPRVDLNTFSANLIETANRLFAVDFIRKRKTNAGAAVEGIRLATKNDMAARSGMISDGMDDEA